jgi:hypothetical protein
MHRAGFRTGGSVDVNVEKDNKKKKKKEEEEEEAS